MTFERFAEEVGRVKYKPRWKIDVQKKEFGRARIHVEGRVQNSKPPHRPWTVDFYGLFAPHAHNVRSVRDCVKSVIFEAEDHEFAEFFRYRGKRLYDPHRV